jgi:hypothetical protein
MPSAQMNVFRARANLNLPKTADRRVLPGNPLLLSLRQQPVPQRRNTALPCDVVRVTIRGMALLTFENIQHFITYLVGEVPPGMAIWKKTSRLK